MSQSVQGIQLKVTTTTGGAGTSTGDNTTSGGGIQGALMSVYLAFHASAPNTTDVTITEVGGAGRTFLTLTDVNTSGEYPIRVAEKGVTGTALGTYAPFLLPGVQLKVALAQCNVLTDAVVATFYILQ